MQPFITIKKNFLSCVLKPTSNIPTQMPTQFRMHET